MTIDRRQLIYGSAALAAIVPTLGMARGARMPAGERIDLWRGPPPGSRTPAPAEKIVMVRERGRQLMWLSGIATPQLHVFRAAKPDGRALLVLPGGGYGFLSMTGEGFDVARSFNPMGISVFVLSYRLPAEGWAAPADVPLQDAQRAMRIIRARAAQWRVNPAKVGVMGFSAGGHLAVTLAKSFDEGVYAPIDAADSRSARPDRAALLYPVISMSTALTHGGSRDNLLGKTPDAALVAKRSGEIGVRADMPPLFLLHAVDDDVVKVDNSLAMLAAARAAGVAADLQILSKGGHGFGSALLPRDHPGALWPVLFARTFTAGAS
jgi:acetyl esterase/lipase